MSDLADQLEPKEPTEEAPSQPSAEAASPPEEPKVEQPKVEEPAIDVKKEVEHRRNLQAALTEERRKRQELERNQAVLAERYNQILGVIQPKPQIPSKDVDPIENHDARLAEAERILKEQAEFQRTQQQKAQQEHNERVFRNHVSTLEHEFAKSTPDYPDAFRFMVERRMKELSAAGYNEGQIREIVDRDAVMISWDAIQNGRNPAETLYNMAVNTGYAKKSPQPTAEQKVTNLQKGTEAAKALGNGSAPAGLPTMEQIADMGEEEFARFKADLKKKGLSLSDVMQ